MTFGAPLVLAFLLTLPVLVALYVFAQRRRTRYAISYPNLPVLARAAGSQRRWPRHIPAALMLLALSILILAAARPQAAVRVPRERAAVVLTIDSSGSMRATDVEPTRMAAAQDAARSFLAVVPDELRVGIVTFDEVVEVLVPPTTDRSAVGRAIESLEPDGGTAIGDALMRSLSLDIDEAPETVDAPLAAIVLLSDGYNTSGDIAPEDAAENARLAEVPVYTVALGTQEGVVVVPGPGGRSVVQPVPPDPETLSYIADTSGGEFFDAPTEEDLRSVYENLGSRVGFRTERKDVTTSFAGGAALVALAAAGLAFGRRGRLA